MLIWKMLQFSMLTKLNMKNLLIALLLLFPFYAESQQQLRLIDAIDTALNNNFSIRIARNNTEISKISNTFGYAGGLPSVNINATDNNQLYNLDQKLNSGVDISKSGVSSSSFNAGLSANMMLFNGFKIIATKEKLNLLQSQSLLQLNQQIQNTIAEIMLNYYRILRQQAYLKIIESSSAVSRKKVEIVNELYNVGMANEGDRLQAEIDLSMAQQNIIGQQLMVDQEKINLQQLIGYKTFLPMKISDTIVIDQSLRRDSIMLFLQNNPQYLATVQQVKINEQIVKELRAQRYPSLRLNTGYSFVYNSSSAGFNLFTQSYGPFLGGSLQIPVFNGTIYKTQQRVANYQVKNANLLQESQLIELQADAAKTWQWFESIQQQMDEQRTSFANAQKLVAIIMQRYQLNQATILDVKAAQDSYEKAGYLLINLMFGAKAAEIELKRLVSQLGNE